MKDFLAGVLVFLTTAGWAQPWLGNVEGGLKGGLTATHGFTTIAARRSTTTGVDLPQLNNKNNGVGFGYSAGVWGRRNFGRGFLQVEVTYNRFVLKQQTNTTLDVNADPALSAALPVSFAPGLLTATVNATSESVLQSINVPILLGRRFLDGKLRAYFGPTLLFVTKAEATRTTAGTINANPGIGVNDAVAIPAQTGSTNLRNRYVAGDLEIKDITYGVEVGVGASPLKGIDVDLRYAAPVGGVYKDRTITGYLGMATLTVGIKIF